MEGYLRIWDSNTHARTNDNIHVYIYLSSPGSTSDGTTRAAGPRGIVGIKPDASKWMSLPTHRSRGESCLSGHALLCPSHIPDSIFSATTRVDMLRVCVCA